MFNKISEDMKEELKSSPTKDEIIEFVINNELPFIMIYPRSCSFSRIVDVHVIQHVRGKGENGLWSKHKSIELINDDNIVEFSKGSTLTTINELITDDIKYCKVFDIRLFYWVLKQRCIKFNVSDSKVKGILYDIVWNTIHDLLDTNDILSLFFYLYLQLMNLGCTTKQYWNKLTINSYEHTSKLTDHKVHIPNELLDEMIDNINDVITNIKF